MGMLKNLFNPIKIGKMEVKNRIVMPAMGIHFGADENGHVTPQLSEYHAARARGGTGLMITQGIAVSPTGKDLAVQISLWDDKYIPALKEMTDLVHKDTETMFGAQILHGGRQVSHDDKVAPSAIPPLAVVQGMPKELSLAEIKEVVGTFGDTAKRSETAGFDFVEIHAAHGYLISEFMALNANKRQDQYGGSFENRIRFLLEILQDMQEKTSPGFPIGIRYNGSDYLPDGWQLEDAVRLAPILQKKGADYLHISAGIYGSPVPGITIPSMYGEYGCFLHLAEAVKKEVDIPVIAVGRIKDPELADQIIKDGKADLVSMGRAHIADPQFPNKARDGKLADIRPCIGCCLGCIQNVFAGEESTCVMNPEVNREYLFQGKDQVAQPKTILVVGAGPAGLGFARAAGKRGHRIIICEENGHIGGVLPIAALPPGRGEFNELITYYQRELQKLGIEIRLNVKLDKTLIEQINPDVAVLATGSLPKIPPMAGLFKTKMAVQTANEVLEKTTVVGDRVIILGGDQIGLMTADYLAQFGKEIIVLEKGDHFASEMAGNDRTYLRERLKKVKVRLFKKVKIEKFLPNGIIFQFKGNEVKEDDFDDIVVSRGMTPVRHCANLFKDKNIEVHFIGDSKEPRTLLDSQMAAYDLGISI